MFIHLLNSFVKNIICKTKDIKKKDSISNVIHVKVKRNEDKLFRKNFEQKVKKKICKKDNAVTPYPTLLVIRLFWHITDIKRF